MPSVQFFHIYHGENNLDNYISMR